MSQGCRTRLESDCQWLNYQALRLMAYFKFCTLERDSNGLCRHFQFTCTSLFRHPIACISCIRRLFLFILRYLTTHTTFK